MDTQFFYEHAGYSYNPKIETAEEGHERCALTLAKAEAWADEVGVEYEWSVDDIDSSFYSDEYPPWPLWYCKARLVIPEGMQSMVTKEQTYFTSLGGIDFGWDKDPWGDPYARVIQAELAYALKEEMQ